MAFKCLDTADSANIQKLGPACAAQLNIATAHGAAFLKKAEFGIIAFVGM